jgi:hypothetical protein
VQSKFSLGLNDCGIPRNCEASTAGIIDPFDGTPLVSLLRSTSSVTVLPNQEKDSTKAAVLARTAYPVVGLYPLVKCKVVMLLVAGSS